MRPRLARWLARRDRGRLMHWLILRLLPRAIALRFDPAAARDLDVTMELAIRHDSRPASYTVAIAGGHCSVRPGRPGDAGARATIGGDDLILLSGGAVSWPQLLSSGRFELTGDPFLALRVASLFRLPVVLDGAGAAGGRAGGTGGRAGGTGGRAGGTGGRAGASAS